MVCEVQTRCGVTYIGSRLGRRRPSFSNEGCEVRIQDAGAKQIESVQGSVPRYPLQIVSVSLQGWAPRRPIHPLCPIEGASSHSHDVVSGTYPHYSNAQGGCLANRFCWTE